MRHAAAPIGLLSPFPTFSLAFALGSHREGSLLAVGFDRDIFVPRAGQRESRGAGLALLLEPHQKLVEADGMRARPVEPARAGPRICESTPAARAAQRPGRCEHEISGAHSRVVSPGKKVSLQGSHFVLRHVLELHRRFRIVRVHGNVVMRVGDDVFDIFHSSVEFFSRNLESQPDRGWKLLACRGERSVWPRSGRDQRPFRRARQLVGEPNSERRALARRSAR